MDLDDIFIKGFLNDVHEREHKKTLLSQEERLIARQKFKKLEPIGQFLQKFVDLEVYVNHSDQYTKNTKTMEHLVPQKFFFYQQDSSKSFSPGISIVFDHPAVVEIAIPNKPEEYGVVVVKVASHHPDAYILEQRFNTFESACAALGKFIGRCTSSIGKDYRKYVSDIDLRRKNESESRGEASKNDFPKAPQRKADSLFGQDRLNDDEE